MGDGVLSSETTLRDGFEAALEALLDGEGLGLFILACTNASLDPTLYRRLRPRLERRFGELTGRLRGQLLQGRRLTDADDDLLVFLKLVAVGFDYVQPARLRAVGPWEVQFNPLRAFRPPRVAQAAVRGVRAEFNPHGFHFARRFLDREVLWAGDLLGRPVALFLNKYPFVELHCLLVPERAAHHPQFIREGDHGYAWRVAETLGRHVPGVGLAYNAYGALASVNHLHFQLFVRDRELPLELGRWRHNGGTDPYPADCTAFDSAAAAWALIEDLHRAEQPYNLLYRPGRLYCLPRRRQGTYETAPWSFGLGWYEMAGGFTVYSAADYEALEAAGIAAELARARVA